ncbi:uncharacterized protein LOC115751430 [Rhodamnia argentea]|uniref:Uncharacterized protein LOC115751430 n=1 Tax=Rhodamnia argentea TaxID=178133 RepID=A0A8B8QF71_9MYRT|nr:uncharacterized protein LOC115751430 [Rhodamnia argentea]
MRWSRHEVAREKFCSCFLYIARPSYLVLKSSRCTGSVNTAISYRREYNSWALSESHSERLSNHSQVVNLPSRRELSNLGYSLKVARSEPYSILKAPALQHWFKDWQEQRKNKLTASTFSSAIGFWRQRRVQLWLEKVGLIEPFSGNLATCWSNIKEKEALECYKLFTGNNITFPEFQVYGNNNSEDSWLAASPDGVVDELVYGLPCNGVLEIKCPYFNGHAKTASPWSRIHLNYIPQVQGLMEILDRDWMDFYVWTPKGSSLFRIYRDKEYWDLLKLALSDFWWKHVRPARELCSKYKITDPLYQLRSFRPAPRHELCSRIVCESKRVVDSSKLLFYEIDGKLQD